MLPSLSPCVGSTLTRQLLEKLNSTIPVLLNISFIKAMIKNWGLEFENPFRTVFQLLVKQRLLTATMALNGSGGTGSGYGRHLWNPEIVCNAMLSKYCHNSTFSSTLLVVVHDFNWL
jgi:hypothetical protein